MTNFRLAELTNVNAINIVSITHFIYTTASNNCPPGTCTIEEFKIADIIETDK